jgi:hypothetical protein
MERSVNIEVDGFGETTPERGQIGRAIYVEKGGPLEARITALRE